jgi:hypothetical protein
MRLWFPILVTPLVTLTQLSVNYALVPLACRTQQHLSIHLVSAAAVAIALAGIVMAWGAWREAGTDVVPDGPTQAARTRFLGMMGVVISAMMALASLAQWLTAVFISPCVS